MALQSRSDSPSTRPLGSSSSAPRQSQDIPQGPCQALPRTSTCTRLIISIDLAESAALEGDRGKIAILGKGGRVRTALISEELYRRLEAHFSRSKAETLAPRRAYQVALRRATLAVGGTATGSHAHRRTSAVEEQNARYRDHLKDGKTTKKAPPTRDPGHRRALGPFSEPKGSGGRLPGMTLASSPCWAGTDDRILLV